MLLFVVASLGENLKMAEEVQALSNELGIESELLVLPDLGLPLYHTGEEKANGVPAQAKELAEKFSHATGFFFVAPEYNGGVPPVLGNALAWVSRAGDKNWRTSFAQKFAAMGTFSGGPGSKLLFSLKQQLEHLGTNVLARTLSATGYKPMNEESAKAILVELKKFL